MKSYDHRLPFKARFKAWLKFMAILTSVTLIAIGFFSGYSPIVKLVFIGSQFALIIGLMIVASQTD